MRTRLLAAEKPLFQGECDFIVLRGGDGDLGVLPGHSPLLTWLRPGEAMLRQGEEERFFFLEGGFLEVLPGLVTILADDGQLAHEISAEEAEEARRRAEDELSRGSDEPEALALLQHRLETANARLETAERARRRRRE